MTHIINMHCRDCGYEGDDVQDFISTDEVGERICPQCASKECYVIDEEVA